MSPRKNTEAESTETESKPVFNVADTDKRNDKRVLLDFVFANRYAPEHIGIFAPWAEQIDADIAEVDAVEGAEIHTPVDTLIAQLTEKLIARYDGEYSDYAYQGKGASYFLPKAKRVVKTVAEKQADLLSSATDEQLADLAAVLAARGIALPTAAE